MSQNQNRQQQDFLIVILAILSAIVIMLLFLLWNPPAESRLGLFFNNFLPSAMVSVISVPVVYFLFARNGIKLANSIDESNLAEAVVSRLAQNPNEPVNDVSPEQPKSQCEDLKKQLIGLWVETFRDSGDDNFAIGAFWLDEQSKNYHYEGTRFDSKGQPIYHWKPHVLFCHDTLRAIIYSYQHFYVNGRKGDDFGLGQLEYEIGPSPGATRFRKGIFSDRDEDCSVTIDMQRLSDLDKGCLSSEMDQEARTRLGPFIAKILKEKRATGPNK